MSKSSLAAFLAISFLAFASTEASGCPLINGEYKKPIKIDGKDYELFFDYNTRQEGGVFSYTVDDKGTFQKADGVARPVRFGDRPGKATVTCSENVVIVLTQEDGSNTIERMEVKKLSDSKIMIKHPEEDRTGVYSKK